MQQPNGESPDEFEPTVSDLIPEPFRSRLLQHLARVNWRPLCHDPRLRRVRSYVETHLHDALSAAVVASVACLHQKSVARYFHKEVTITLAKFVRLVRMHRAAELLANGSRSVADVRSAVGVRDPGTFERNFRAIFDVTPRTFKSAVAPPRLTRGSGVTFVTFCRIFATF
jgi:transcriptional regulator GlxA family with amidase domain